MFQNRNIATLLVTLLGAVKIVLQAFGVNIIDDSQINAIADGVAAVLAVVGVYMTHIKTQKSASGAVAAGK